MAAKSWVRYGLVLAVPCVMVLSSCAGKTGGTDMAEQEMAEQLQEEEAARIAAEEEARKAEEARIEAERLAREKAEAKKKEEAKAAFLESHVPFDFDSFALNSGAMKILDAKVVWLRNNPAVKVTVEGHCDDRGTREYNLALGDRRARSVKQYLVDSGISADRIATISYGEERPLDPAKNEAAWSKNRRAQFVIR
ncbi:peptidoglycan-associated lipoprotein Pal [Desulfobotulus sp. H1]|uniref:Peptidoglycan-associated lipoprotein n=1 Tax=Desulfobotulus pelophilus TaxID=2823377 RepID=A0ABT3N5L5_9BACT|nr:peptidoglycan-associated lipoprotein Pal [Desulfobotulus pelophilus]MCW7752749.1 peptidoglycan-associated lipoprotein Pal [Desulfobotulus pelophilus]